MNIYSGSPGGSGVMLGTNGVGAYTPAGVASGRSYSSTGSVLFASSHQILVSLVYSNQILNVTLTDLNTTNSFVTNYPVNIPAFVGTNAAYVGFTGGEGAVYSSQTISDFSYAPLPTANLTTSDGNSMVLTWPASVAGFVVQQTPVLDGGTWTTPSVTITQTNNMNQATMPMRPNPRFYRLMLPPN
jgi:hypothetical protein